MKRDGLRTAVQSLRSMSVKSLCAGAALLLMFASGWAAPQPSYQTSRQAPPVKEDPNAVMRQMKTALGDLRHEVSNHESEIRTFDEKLQNQEASFEQLRQLLTDDVQTQRDFVKASNINLEGKTETLEQSINTLDAAVKGLTADLRQMKTQANDSVSVLAQHKQKLGELEKLLETQNQHMQNLEAALHSIMEVLQAKQPPKEMAVKVSEGGLKTYKVQPGDSLERIARAQKVSVQALRDANQLSNDRIIVGQTLKIP